MANSWELSQLLTAAAENEKLAVELMQNVHEPTVADAFRGATSRALHSYLASSATVIDHARRLMRGRKGPLAEEYERRRKEAVKNLELLFVQDLRSFALHRSRAVARRRCRQRVARV